MAALWAALSLLYASFGTFSALVASFGTSLQLFQPSVATISRFSNPPEPKKTAKTKEQHRFCYVLAEYTISSLGLFWSPCFLQLWITASPKAAENRLADVHRDLGRQSWQLSEQP